jgi:S-DNA-T family DNA segregation ATPase FtsK/SpoIIIE
MTTTTAVPIADPAPEPDRVRVPVAPMLSMFDPIYLGIDEYGHPAYCEFVYRNLLAGGEPGGGKSGLLNTVAAHAALSDNTRLVLFDGKLVELGLWEDCADEFIGPDLDHAIDVLHRLQQVLNNRYAWLKARKRRKLTRDDRMSVIVIIVDEIALYSATLGKPQEREEFIALFRDLVSRGRAAAMPVLAATQRPSFDIIPTSLRDLFGYRAAFRCTTTNSSNIVLGQGWAEHGYTANDISPTNQGECYLIAEGGIPRRIKVAYLTDQHIIAIAEHATWIRRPTGIHTPPVTGTDRKAA